MSPFVRRRRHLAPTSGNCSTSDGLVQGPSELKPDCFDGYWDSGSVKQSGPCSSVPVGRSTHALMSAYHMVVRVPCCPASSSRRYSLPQTVASHHGCHPNFS